MNRLLQRLKFILFLFAALWAIVAGLWLALSPYAIEVITASGDTTGAAISETSTKQVSFYAVQGAQGIFVLVVFVLLYSSGPYLLRIGHPWLAVVGNALALTLTLLAGFSVGPAYLPAAMAAVISIALILFTAIMPPARL
jgi:hypothetical protein